MAHKPVLWQSAVVSRRSAAASPRRAKASRRDRTNARTDATHARSLVATPDGRDRLSVSFLSPRRFLTSRAIVANCPTHISAREDPSCQEHSDIFARCRRRIDPSRCTVSNRAPDGLTTSKTKEDCDRKRFADHKFKMVKQWLALLQDVRCPFPIPSRIDARAKRRRWLDRRVVLRRKPEIDGFFLHIVPRARRAGLLPLTFNEKIGAHL